MLPLHQRGVGATGVEPACTFTLSAGYKPEGIRPGRAPRDRTWRYRCIRAAPSTSWVVLEARKMEVSSLTARQGRHGCSRPAAAPAAHLPSRNEEVPTPTALTASRFRGGARPWRVLVPESAPRPGVNRQGMEEDGRLERHCSHSRPVSGRGQSPDWFIFRGERVTRTPRR
jgi:hypothetical protein